MLTSRPSSFCFGLALVLRLGGAHAQSIPAEARAAKEEAKTAIAEERWDDALVAVSHAIADAPRWAEPYLLRSNIRMILAGPDATLERFASPRHGIDYEAMASALRGAAGDLERYVELAPKDAAHADQQKMARDLRARAEAATAAFQLLKELKKPVTAPASLSETFCSVGVMTATTEALLSCDAAMAADRAGDRRPGEAVDAWGKLSRLTGANPFRQRAAVRAKTWRALAERRAKLESFRRADTERLRKILPLRSIGVSEKEALLRDYATLFGDAEAMELLVAVQPPEARTRLCSPFIAKGVGVQVRVESLRGSIATPASVLIDGVEVGTAPGSFRIPACAQKLGISEVATGKWWDTPLAGAVLPGTITAQFGATPQKLAWSATAERYRGKVGEVLEFLCPADGLIATIYGTDVYADESSICTAAVHAGIITREQGGLVFVEVRAGQKSYTGSTRNGIMSNSWGSQRGSIAFRRPPTNASARQSIAEASSASSSK